MPRDIQIDFYHRPGRSFSAAGRARLAAELCRIGETCFEALPDYQVFRGADALDDKVITVARDASGRAVGFCAGILLDVPGVPSVLHLGLTCVDPATRGRRLTHRLTGRLAMQYLARHRLFGRTWISNVACVLSSVGNVALSFDEVFPSPWTHQPSATHRQIAEVISARYRDDIHIDPAAVFDARRFVFRGSVGGTVFHKDAEDARFHHREAGLNAFYTVLLDFDAGDEVVQIGHFSLATLRRYLASGFGRRRPSIPPVPDWAYRDAPLRAAA